MVKKATNKSKATKSNKSKATSKKKTVDNFQPTKMALAVSSLAATTLVMLAVVVTQ